MAGRINVAEAPKQNFGILGAPSPAPVDFSRTTMFGQSPPLPSPAMGNTQTSTPQTSNFGTMQVVGELGGLADRISGAAAEAPGRILAAGLEKVTTGEAQKAAQKASAAPIRGFSEHAKEATAGLPKPIAGPVAFLAGTIGDPGNLIGGGEAKAGAKALEELLALAKKSKNIEEFSGAIKTLSGDAAKHSEQINLTDFFNQAKGSEEFKGALGASGKESATTLPSLNNSQRLASEDLAGLREPSDSTTSMMKGEDSKSTQNVLSPNRINFLNAFDVSKDSITPESLAHYYESVKKDEPLFVGITDEAAGQIGGEYVYRLKTPESIGVKLTRKEGRTLGSLGDTLASTVVTHDVDAGVQQIRNAVESNGGTIKVDDFRERPTFLGYKSVHVDVELPSGIKTEIQVMPKEMLYQKEEAHDIYDTWRPYIESGQGSTEDEIAKLIPPELEAAFRADVRRSIDIYEGKIPVPAEKITAVDSRIKKPGQNAIPETETGKTAVGKTETPSQLPEQPSQSLPTRAGVKLPEFSSYKKDVTAFANEKLNVEHLNISPEGKAIVTRVVDEVKPKIQEKVGKVLSNSEALNLADNTSKILKRVVGREDTLDWQAAMLNARRSLAAAAETGRVDQAFIDNLMAIKTQGSDIARKLQSLSIGADPKEVTTAQALIEAVLDAGHNVDEVLKAAEGVDFNDLNQATNFYRKFIKPKASEWLDLLRYNSMLSSPKTHIVNAIANLVNTTLVVPIEKALTGGLDFLGSKMTGAARTAYAGEGGAYLKNYLANVKEATFRFADVMTGKRAMTNLDTRDIPIANSGVKGAVAKTLGYPMRLLEGMDQFFTALAEGGEKGALNYRKSKGVKVGNIESKAERSAAYRVFRQELFDEDQGVVLDGIDQLTNLLQQARTSKNPIVSTVAKFTVPFLRTPMNIFKQGMEYSPVGFTTMLGAKNKTEQLSKAIIGSAIFAGAATMVASNRITWGEPIDPTLKAAFRAGGMQAYSVKVGNTWVSYQKLPPGLAFPLAMVAAIHDAQQNKKIDDNTVDMILGGIAKYGEFLADQSYAKSIGDLLASAKGGEAGIAKVVSNYGQQLVPYRALGGWLARLTDETQRKVDTSAGFIDQQVQLLMMNIPGLSDNVPAREDAQGNPIPQQHRFANAFSPVSFTTENESAGEFQKLMDIKEVNKKATFDTAQVKEQAQTEFEKIKSLGSSEEKKAYLKQIAAENPELAEKIIAVAKADQKTGNLEASEQRLLDSPIATRAQFIVDELNKLQTPEEKKALLKNYAQKKILTEDTLKKVAQILGK